MEKLQSPIQARYRENEKENSSNQEGKTDEEDSVRYYVKILLSGQLAWAVSSKTESKVIWMLEKFGTDVRLSRNDDFYPGTSERVCLINGKITQIKVTLDWIFNLNCEERGEGVQIRNKIVVPKSSLGTLINRNCGKRYLSEKEKVEIHIPEYNDDVLREVCITITGKKQNLIETCISIAKIIKNDMYSAICRNVSYEDFNSYLRSKEQNSFQKYLNKPIVSTFTTLQRMQQVPMQFQQSNYIQQQQSLHQPILNFSCNQQVQQNGLNPPIILQHSVPLQQEMKLTQIQQMEALPRQKQLKIDVELKTENRMEGIINSFKNGNESVRKEAQGNPIPSITSFWKRVSSETWRFGNNQAQAQNLQSNVEVIPGIG